jgi:hypothetical protein
MVEDLLFLPSLELLSRLHVFMFVDEKCTLFVRSDDESSVNALLGNAGV